MIDENAEPEGARDAYRRAMSGAPPGDEPGPVDLYRAAMASPGGGRTLEDTITEMKIQDNEIRNR